MSLPPAVDRETGPAKTQHQARSRRASAVVAWPLFLSQKKQKLISSDWLFGFPVTWRAKAPPEGVCGVEGARETIVWPRARLTMSPFSDWVERGGRVGRGGSVGRGGRVGIGGEGGRRWTDD